MLFLTITEQLKCTLTNVNFLYFLWKLIWSNDIYLFKTYFYNSFSFLLRLFTTLIYFQKRKYIVSLLFNILVVFKNHKLQLGAGAGTSKYFFPQYYYNVLVRKIPVFTLTFYLIQLITLSPLLSQTWSMRSSRLVFNSVTHLYFYDSAVMRFVLV